jgi:hypothetical protein
MRASSLSNPRVIDLLNQYFVPVHADGVYYKGNDSVPADEKAAYQRVFQEFHRLNKKNQAAGKLLLSIGTVHAYVLTSDGKALASLHVAEARPERLIKMLEQAIGALKVAKGKPVVQPTAQSAAPRAKADSLVLHLTTRYLVPRNQPEARKDAEGEYVPVAAKLGTERSGSWAALPSEDWIELKKAEWLKLLPAGAVRVGQSWDVDREVAAQLLTRFYPTTENNDLTTNRIDRQALRATVLSVKDGVCRARLEGSLKMKHTFYPRRDDANVVEATLVGYLDFDMAKRSIQTLRLVTSSATYGGASRHFGAALRSVPSRSD